MNKWYTIEKNQYGYTVWFNQESIENENGGGGCFGVFTSQFKKDCIQYCKEHKIIIGKFD